MNINLKKLNTNISSSIVVHHAELRNTENLQLWEAKKFLP